MPENFFTEESTQTVARLSEAELAAHWMPFTGNRQFKKDPRLLVAASGMYYTDADGRQVLDGLSGLWTCGLGHGRQEITDAVSRQIAALDYSPGFQFGQGDTLHRAVFFASARRVSPRHSRRSKRYSSNRPVLLRAGM